MTFSALRQAATAALVLLSACQTASDGSSPGAAAPATRISLLSGNADPRDLPQDYFAGFGTQWYVNIHNWGNRIGKERYFEPLARDLSRYRAAGAPVMRYQMNMDGAIFWAECDWQTEADFQEHNACYDRNYQQAGAADWQTQITALEDEADNPVIDAYVRGARRLQDNGFHVMLAPSDFFWGNGGDWKSAPDVPLLHAYMERDRDFQDYYVALTNRLVSRMIAGGMTNFSLQTLNEPRFCNDGEPRRRAWQTLERRIIDAARMAAPGLHVISSAVCTAGDQPLSRMASYSSAGQYLPDHGDIGNISYAFHMRNPRLLHIADHQDLAQGTRLHYPFERLPSSAGRNENTRKQIEIYNRVRPDAAFYERVFADLAQLGTDRGAPIVVTEWSISKPDYGLPRADRVALANDVLQASRRAGVPIIYNGLLGREGLSSSPDDVMIPHHDFDPQLLAAFAAVNAR